MSDYTQTTVFIWNNHMYGSHRYPGHASMSIDGQWQAGANTYVSWWPDSQKDGFLDLARPKLEFFADLKEEGYAPDHIIRIDGLRLDAMTAKWNERRNKQNAHYRFLKKNCSTVVSAVLKAGGLRGSTMARNNLVWTPLKVRDLAMDMGGRTISWDALLGEFVRDGYMNNADRVVLTNLFRRDEKHGKNSSGNQAYYAKGQKIHQKSHLMWAGGRFELGDKGDGVNFFYASEGSLLSSGQISDHNGMMKKIFDHKEVKL